MFEFCKFLRYKEAILLFNGFFMQYKFLLPFCFLGMLMCPTGIGSLDNRNKEGAPLSPVNARLVSNLKSAQQSFSELTLIIGVKETASGRMRTMIEESIHIQQTFLEEADLGCLRVPVDLSALPEFLDLLLTSLDTSVGLVRGRPVVEEVANRWADAAEDISKEAMAKGRGELARYVLNPNNSDERLLERWIKSKRTGTPPPPQRSLKFSPLVTGPEFEIENGVLGMKRDILLRLCALMGEKPNKLRTLLGMSAESFIWKNHHYFISGRTKAATGAAQDLGSIFIKLIDVIHKCRLRNCKVDALQEWLFYKLYNGLKQTIKAACDENPFNIIRELIEDPSYENHNVYQRLNSSAGKNEQVTTTWHGEARILVFFLVEVCPLWSMPRPMERADLEFTKNLFSRVVSSMSEGEIVRLAPEIVTVTEDYLWDPSVVMTVVLKKGGPINSTNPIVARLPRNLQDRILLVFGE